MNPQPLHLLNIDCLQIIFYFLDRNSLIFLSEIHSRIYHLISVFFSNNSSIIQKKFKHHLHGKQKRLELLNSHYHKILYFKPFVIHYQLDKISSWVSYRHYIKYIHSNFNITCKKYTNVTLSTSQKSLIKHTLYKKNISIIDIKKILSSLSKKQIKYL